ncbi:MAG: hypothetical protein RLY86_3738 [Pseudomonadota bacterium]
MPKPLHMGPLVFAAFFIVATIAMGLIGTLPLHLAVAAKLMMLAYAGLLVALAFAPVKGMKPARTAAEAVRDAGFTAGAKG